MIPNCRGCKYEFEEAYYEQSKGNHVATCVDYPGSENIGYKGHYAMIIVDSKGKILIQ